ncbi:MAG TPA: hypothetical protein DIT97_10640 [Gimesia maris]|uniref:DUF1778 domain-containing protein n=2 Tax=Planctomycetaceae TaxID=126 RepID=A0A3D3R3M7_9PLAN|nr:hypothetical protein [Gimesia maris]|tara:strand:- start:109 stop:345 length:237 start_codon:yes stop_codon:yes gene_type:complete
MNENPMAKKKSATTEENEKEVYLKVKLTPKERKLIKMAAAECEMSISDFMHDAIMNRAEQDTMRFYQREMTRKKSPKK